MLGLTARLKRVATRRSAYRIFIPSTKSTAVPTNANDATLIDETLGAHRS